MGKFVDMAGETVGKIRVIKLHHMHKNNGAYWECLCDCGNTETFIVSGKNIRQKKVLSCGCLNRINGLNKRDNLLGQKFGRLTVIDFEYNTEKNRMIWVCSCDCGEGKLIKTPANPLKNGRTKSCGCYRRRRLPFGENAFNRLYHSYKSKSEKREFAFEFTKDEFREITSKNCFYCGKEPSQSASPTLKGYGNYTYNGIDRLDNSIGYTKENSVPCCGQCNVAKNNYSVEEFLDWIERVYKNINGKQ